jgi:hypothetical protein
MGFELESESESELLSDWRFTGNHFFLVTSPLRLTTSNFIFQPNTCDYSPYVTSSLTRRWICHLQLLLVLHSAVILRSEPHFTVSDPRFPQPGGPGPCIYIPQEQGHPAIPPGTGCRIWGSHSFVYEEYYLLGYKLIVRLGRKYRSHLQGRRTSQEGNHREAGSK